MVLRTLKTFAVVLLIAVLGCQTKPSTSQMLVSSAGPERMRAVMRLAKQNRWENVPTLISFLEDEDGSVRLIAIGALDDQVGTTMGFRSTDPAEDRAVAVESWKQWWQTDGHRGPHARPKPTSP